MLCLRPFPQDRLKVGGLQWEEEPAEIRTPPPCLQGRTFHLLCVNRVNIGRQLEKNCHKFSNWGGGENETLATIPSMAAGCCHGHPIHMLHDPYVRVCVQRLIGYLIDGSICTAAVLAMRHSREVCRKAFDWLSHSSKTKLNKM